MPAPDDAPSAFSFGPLRRHPAAATLAICVLCMVVGWIMRGVRDNGWRIGPEPVRWHPVKLVEVLDGETITVQWEGRTTPVRLLDIATPDPGEPGHEEAAAFLRDRLRDATGVILEFGEDGVYARDREGRLLCYAWWSGCCLNTSMVQAGHAGFRPEDGAGKHRDAFQTAVQNARLHAKPSAP